MAATDGLSTALQLAQSAWTGCDWDTDFGARRANLRGLSSRQARLAAEATRGTESEFWREASQYLDAIERDAATAASLASEAVVFWQLGNSTEALERLEGAIALESRYRRSSAYAAVREKMTENILAP